MENIKCWTKKLIFYFLGNREIAVFWNVMLMEYHPGKPGAEVKDIEIVLLRSGKASV